MGGFKVEGSPAVYPAAGQGVKAQPKPGDNPAAVTPVVVPPVTPTVVLPGQETTVTLSGGAQKPQTANPLNGPPVQKEFPTPNAPANETAPASEVTFAEITPEIQTRFDTFAKKVNSSPNLNYIEIDRRDTHKGLSDHLANYKSQIDANPELRAKLSQTEVGREFLKALDNAASGKLGSTDIINIQAFLVASGANISHKGSASGIDGDYGPLTHNALDQVMNRLQNKPDEVTTALATGNETARRNAVARQTEDEGFGQTYVPPSVNPSSMTFEPNVGPTPTIGSTTSGGDIAAAANATSGRMAQILAERTRAAGRPVYRCYEGVKLALNNLNPPISLTGGSAYMAADQLKAKYADRFQDVRQLNPKNPKDLEQLKNLPKGAIVVWGRSDNPALRAKNPNNGFSHGHISISMGGGQEYSDRFRSQSMNRDGRYDSLTVFIPK